MEKQKRAGGKKKIRVTQDLTEEQLLEDARRDAAPDPLTSLMKSYLMDEIPYPEEELSDIDFKIKARKVIGDSSAKCPKFQSDSLENCTDQLWDRYGGGFYHLYISYRRLNTEIPDKGGFVKVLNVPILPDEQEESHETPGDVGRGYVENNGEDDAREEPRSSQSDFLTKMLLKSQDTMQAVMLELVHSRSENPPAAASPGANEILDAFQRGADMVSDLRDSTGGVPDDPDSIPSKIRQWLPIINMAREYIKPGAAGDGLKLSSSGEIAAPAEAAQNNGNAPIKKLKEVLSKPENAAALKELLESPETSDMAKQLMTMG